MPSFDQSEIKKREFLVAKDGNTGNVIKVVFPNGIQVGIPGYENFNSGIVLSNGTTPPAETANALYAVNGTVYFNGSPLAGGGGGAPATAQYVTLATDATLTNERVLVGGDGLTLTDGGAGASVTLAVGAGTDITVNSNDIQVNRSTLATAFAGNGLSDAGSSLSVNPGNGIKIVADAVVIDDSVVATVSGTTFSGNVTINANLTVNGHFNTTDIDASLILANQIFS